MTACKPELWFSRADRAVIYASIFVLSLSSCPLGSGHTSYLSISNARLPHDYREYLILADEEQG